MLAARLATYGKRVLLLEAGDDQGSNINLQVPGYHAKSTEDDQMSWGFFVKHYSDSGQAVKDDKMAYTRPDGSLYVGLDPPSGSTRKGIFYPRAGTLGGCSTHNAMINVYGVNNDWYHIQSITGDSSWSPDNMRKYYQRLSRCEDKTCLLSPGTGLRGWLGIRPADITLALTDTKLLRVGLSAASAIGSSVIKDVAKLLKLLAGDINAYTARRDFTEAVYQLPLDTSGGYRQSARDFIVSVYTATNPDGTKKYPLEVRLNTLVTKVLFDPATGAGKPKAIGVEFLQGRGLYKASPLSTGAPAGIPGRAFATNEVILSGGAFNTPQLLKLSGIGPRAELTNFNIPVIADLPGVGGNLQDHFEIGVTAQTKKPFDVLKDCTLGDPATDPCFKQWQKTPKSGPYASSNGFIYAITKLSSVAVNANPDVFVFGGPAFFKGYYPGYSRDVYSKQNWTWTILKAYTGNRAGTVNLTSADGRDTPEINFRFFDEGSNANGESARDVQAMAEGVALGRKILEGVFPLLGEEKPVFTETLPGASVTAGAKLNEYIKNRAWSHHASCTAPIGGDSDPMAVLDAKFRVRGVEGLRVVDASAFPRVPGWFTVVPTYMLGEKAADVIADIQIK